MKDNDPPELDIEIVPFDVHAATREEWSRFHAYRRLRHVEESPDDPLVADATEEGEMKHTAPGTVSFRFAAQNRGTTPTIVAWVVCWMHTEESPNYEAQGHLLYAYPHVLPQYRRRGIGREFLRRILDLAREHGKSIIRMDTHEADGIAFFEAVGAKVAHRWRESRLYLDRVDWGMVQQWADEGPRRSPQSSLHWARNGLDDAVLDAYCQLYAEVENQEPRGELDVGDRVLTPTEFRDRIANHVGLGGSWLTAYTVEESGEFSGLTEVYHHPDQEHMLIQDETGVRERFRGRGLGKWLKAAMLLRVREELPQVGVVVTRNATTNAAMLSINTRLGFRPYREGVDTETAVQTLETYLRHGT